MLLEDLCKEKWTEMRLEVYREKGVLTVLAQESLKACGKIDQDTGDSVVSRMVDAS